MSCAASQRLLVVDTEAGLVGQLGSGGLLLDTLRDAVLSLHTSPQHGERLLLARLLQPTTTTLLSTEQPTTTTVAPTTTEPVTTTLAASTITTSTTTTTDAPVDPCQEFIDSLREQMKQEETTTESSEVSSVSTETAETETTTHHHHRHNDTAITTRAGHITTEVTTHHHHPHSHTTEVTTHHHHLHSPTTEKTETPTTTAGPLPEIAVDVETVSEWVPVVGVVTRVAEREAGDMTRFPVRVSSREVGTGQPLLLSISAPAGPPLPLPATLLWLQAGYTVLECGGRAGPGGGLAGRAQDCHLAVMAELGEGAGRRVVVAGRGLGGGVAALLAAEYPHIYHLTILSDPVVSLPGLAAIRPRVLARLLGVAAARPADMARAWADSPARRPPRAGAVLLLSSGQDPQVTPAMHTLRCAVLVICAGFCLPRWVGTRECKQRALHGGGGRCGARHGGADAELGGAAD